MFGFGNTLVMGKAIIFATDNHKTNNRKNKPMKMKNLLFVILATLGLTASTMAQNLPNYIPANGLVGWWPFNGNANDESGNGNNGTVNGASLTTDRFGDSNKSYDFTGSTIIPSYIEGSCGSFPIGNRTVSLWFYANNIGVGNEGRALLGYGGQTCGQSWLENIDNYGNGGDIYEVQGHCQNQQVLYNYGSIHPNGTWIHWLITTDSLNGTNFYLNGLNVKTDPTFINQTYVLDKKFIFGAMVSNNGNNYLWDNNCFPFNGKLDDIGIWNRALTQQEITYLYNAVNCANNTTISPLINLLAIGSTATFNATTSDPNPSYVWQSNLGQGFQTLNDIENYSGTNTSTLNIANVLISEHLQPIRVITTSGECVDTSDIATISILDTCVTSINDTSFITVTDTLVINTLITSNNPPNNSNTIKIYPNPSNSHITIEYGDFTIMDGYQLRIENSLGQEVFQTSITQQSDYLNLSSWGGNGLYFVHIVDPQGNTIDIRKIVLQ